MAIFSGTVDSSLLHWGHIFVVQWNTIFTWFLGHFLFLFFPNYRMIFYVFNSVPCSISRIIYIYILLLCVRITRLPIRRQFNTHKFDIVILSSYRYTVRSSYKIDTIDFWSSNLKKKNFIILGIVSPLNISTIDPFLPPISHNHEKSISSAYYKIYLVK